MAGRPESWGLGLAGLEMGKHPSASVRKQAPPPCWRHLFFNSGMAKGPVRIFCFEILSLSVSGQVHTGHLPRSEAFAEDARRHKRQPLGWDNRAHQPTVLGSRW